MSSPLHFDMTKRGSTEANILEIEGSERAENKNLKNYIFRKSAQEDEPLLGANAVPVESQPMRKVLLITRKSCQKQEPST